MRPARTWDWPRTRRYDELSNDRDPSSPRQFYPEYIIATPGYDFQEGQVETEQQLDILRAEGCMQVQGFLFSKAVPVTEIPLLTQRLRPRSRVA